MQQKIQKMLNRNEIAIIKKLYTPNKVQDFLDTLPFNFEEKGETYYSPRMVFKNKKAHCFEGAILAHLCLTYHKFENYLLDLKTEDIKKDSDHIICIFKINGFWGAVSKTNHSVLRWRDPIYKTTRELAISYFHEYFLNNGKKTLLSFSRQFSVFAKFGTSWITEKKDLDKIAEAIDRSPHFEFIPSKNKNLIRKVSKVEIVGASTVEWQKNKKVI